MTNKLDYSILLPCYMEAENLNVLLPQIKAVMMSMPYSFEIIVIDANQNMDDTSRICNDNDVKHVHRSPSNSYGDAFRTGLRAGNGRWFIFMDSDGSHPPSFIPKLISASKQEDNILVVASRYIQGGESANNIILVLMSKLLNQVYSKVLNIHCKDVSNSFRLYPSALLKGFILQCGHFDILEEVLFKMVRKNKHMNIIEVPFSFEKRIYGESKRNFLVFLFNYLKTLTKLRYIGWKEK